jgi:alpha-glucuronidase
MKSFHWVMRNIEFRRRIGAVCASLAILLVARSLHGKEGDEAWLRHAPFTSKEVRDSYARLPAVVVGLDDESETSAAARQELVHGLRRMLGRTLRIERKLTKESSIILGTFATVKKALPSINHLPQLAEDGFWLKSIDLGGKNHLLVTSPSDRGVLYGTMFLLRKLALAEPIAPINEEQSPYVPLRVIRHADKLDGSVVDGFAGRSIFWEAGRARSDLRQVADYGRLLASIGINGCVVNHAEDGAQILSSGTIRETSRIADVLRPWGVRVYVAVPITSPQVVGGSRTSDPLDAGVVNFWTRTVEAIYQAIPDLGGFVVVPASAGRVVPRTYGRTHAEAANAIAEPLRARGGKLLYVTDFELEADWRRLTNDFATTAYEEFGGLDGMFANNVVLLSNIGPAGFQVREPISPLFAKLQSTDFAVGLSIAQRLTGQQRHVCFLAPAWKAALEFDLRAGPAPLPLKQLVAGHGRQRPAGGFVATAGVGRDANWLAHPLNVANLYAFGRLAWDPELKTKGIAEEWARLSFGHDPLVVGTVADVLMRSRRIYENYTGPLGAGPPTDVAGTAYGPGIDASSAGPSDWRFADESGLGHDRASVSGSGFANQYPLAVAETFKSLETCPDELLLFMHHVPYTHVLKSGKTVIQHMYDAHYQGARDAAAMAEKWRRLEGLVDEPRYRDVLGRLEYQAGHAQVWRDAVCNWLARKSGVDDAENRVGRHAKRIEAEDMELDGYEVRNASPWESASGGEYVACTSPEGMGSVGWKHSKKAGWMDINVWYFDEADGVSDFRLLLGNQVIDEWSADLSLPDDEPNGHTAIRHRTANVALRPGDELRIEAIADGDERACLDYVEIIPAE